MNVKELKSRLDFARETDEVVIQINLPFRTAGSTPCVSLNRTVKGFDWDHGKFFIIPEEPLTGACAEFEDKFKELQEKAGWLMYENTNLKRDISNLKKKIQGE